MASVPDRPAAPAPGTPVTGVRDNPDWTAEQLIRFFNGEPTGDQA